MIEITEKIKNMSAVVEKDRCGHVFVWRKLNFDHLLLVFFWKAVLNLSVTTEVYKLDASMSLRSILRPRGGMVSVSDNRIRSGSELSFEMRVSSFSRSFRKPKRRAVKMISAINIFLYVCFLIPSII